MPYRDLRWYISLPFRLLGGFHVMLTSEYWCQRVAQVFLYRLRSESCGSRSTLVVQRYILFLHRVGKEARFQWGYQCEVSPNINMIVSRGSSCLQAINGRLAALNAQRTYRLKQTIMVVRRGKLHYETDLLLQNGWSHQSPAALMVDILLPAPLAIVDRSRNQRSLIPTRRR